MFSKNGLMDKIEEKKWNFAKKNKGKEEKEAEQEENKGFKERAFGGTKEEKPLK